MAAGCGRLWTVILLCLVGQTAAFGELDERDWDYLGPDVASIHRLKGLADHFKHQPIRVQRDYKLRTPGESDGLYEGLPRLGGRNKGSNSYSDPPNNPRLEWYNMLNLTDLKHCPDIAECILEKTQDFDRFLENIETKKTHDALLYASEISYTYINKVILIMDNDTVTLKKANDEYSEDPHFSTKVNMSCLDSSSCAPKVDTGTVLKIIGSSSEDGNTLSGYNGAELASLMTKAQKASLFSISGNVSRTFRNTFIRVFSRLRDTKVVLETTLQNDHVYQIIDDTGASVEYQVPKRRVDHSTQYDKQHILILQDDPIVRDVAKYLYDKHPAVSSVYKLENGKPKLIIGDSESLTAESRLVLVGHGEKGNDGEMRLGGYKAEKVAEFVKHMNIEENQIKTTSVVACEVGSDETFRNTLLKELHARSIETKLHLRSSLLQVTHTGQKITAEIKPDGLVWKHDDHSKKVVVKLDKNGEIVTQIQPGNRAEATFTQERNILGNNIIYPWPENPQRFVSKDDRGTYTDDLEALACHFFIKRNGDLITRPELRNNDRYTVYDLQKKWNESIRDYIYGESKGWLNSETHMKDIENILNQCYEMKSGEDILNVITKYARGVEGDTYLMLNDWIYKVSAETLYVYPVGKKLNAEENEHDIQIIIKEQFDKERYSDIKDGINKWQASEYYANYVKYSLQGTYTRQGSALKPNQEAWLSTMFLATVISESARNFRSFPITLMALDLAHNQNWETARLGRDFLLNNHPMTRGKTWINRRNRGFYGSSIGGGTKTENLRQLIRHEDNIVDRWLSSYGTNEITPETFKRLLKLYGEHNNLNTDSSLKETFKESFTDIKTAISNHPSTSGILGGSHDGPTTLENVHAAAEVESSLKLSSQYSRSSAILTEHVHTELQKRFGEKAKQLHVKPDSVVIRDGEFHCELVFDTNPAEVEKWKVALPDECKILMEKLKKHITEIPVLTTTHTTSVHLEEAGKLLGVTGLLLSAQGAVNAFKHGDIETGVVATLQTIHGGAGMTLAALGEHLTVAAKSKVMKAISTGLKNPAIKRTMGIVMPVTGIAFGVYNIAEDAKRDDALGKIDFTLDTLMLGLDVVELVQPEVAPSIFKVNLALGAIRLFTDNIYVDIQDELKNLPSHATVLDKIGAVLKGLGEGFVHTLLDIVSFFCTIPYREIENGHRLVEGISDYRAYFSKTEVQDGSNTINFAGGKSSWNGGGITFCLSDDSFSEMCMDYSMSPDEFISKQCWYIDTTNTNDIVLGIGESHKLTYSNVEIKILLFIPAGSITVPSGYEALTYSRYGTYSGNNKENKFFAVQKSDDSHQMEIMLSYFYKLYGKGGGDTFYLGPQRSYVEGQSGKDIYILPEDGGFTTINNYDPLKVTDLLILSINYDQISVTETENHVILQYSNDHYVKILEWFTGEEYRHMKLMSADGVLFDISKVVFSSVKLVAKGVNIMSKPEGQTVDTTEPLLRTVTNIMGSPFDDRLIGNAQKNVINGGGGRDFLMGGEGEDVYVVNKAEDSRVLIENYSRKKETDILIIEANLLDFKTRVDGDNLILIPFNDYRTVTLRYWFDSEEHRHLLVVTNDFFTFSLSADKTLCSQSDPHGSKCIQIHVINYSESTLPLVIDLETDEAYLNVTELRGSNFNDVIKGNAQGNTFYPGAGRDFLQGRGGQDLYIVTPGDGLNFIDNFSPDMALDTLFFNLSYSLIEVECLLPDLLLVNENVEVLLINWFDSKMSQHLQVQTADGIIFSLQSSQCTDNMKLPKSVDYRRSKPGQNMLMNNQEFVSVVKMYGSPGFDTMIGNDNDNWLDPFTGGAFMKGGEGMDTYIVKPGYGIRLEIDNFADDEKVDTVDFQAEFLSTPFSVAGENDDVIISANKNEENMMIKLRNYRAGQKHQHLSFQSADGVHFWVRSPVANQSDVLQDPWIEAFKVNLKDKQSDCFIDLSSQKNLSTVYKVEGCSVQSNHIHGNDQDNTLIGGAKHDVLEGGDGHDSLIGWDGNDILIGSQGNDTLYGGDGDDTLLGGIGWDIFVPGLGADVMDGGPGQDTVVYQGDDEKGEGVYVSLLSGEGHQADAEGDVLKDIENVIGTIYSDILVSGYEPALLKGSDGDDVLVSVTAGDYLIGGKGRDIYMMVPHHGLVTIDNCAEDNAMDILYLPFVTKSSLECNKTSSGLQLKFLLADSTFLEIFLQGWVNDTHKCGHMTLILP